MLREVFDLIALSSILNGAGRGAVVTFFIFYEAAYLTELKACTNDHSAQVQFFENRPGNCWAQL